MAVIPSGETWRFYYFAGSQRIAMRTADSTTSSLVYFLGDHLGSTSLTVDPDGSMIAEMRYTAWGETRYTSEVATPTDYQYTGQRNEMNSIGLYYYNARWYDPYITHFNQPDTITPGGPQGLNRYAYGYNNPSRYMDPSGHRPCDDEWDCRRQRFKSRIAKDAPPRRPTIVPRSDWGAAEPGTGPNANDPANEGLFGDDNEKGYKDYVLAGGGDLPDYLDTIVLHHEGDIATHSVLQVQTNQMNDGYYDIAYHFIIGADGTIYEGRDIGVRGSHVSADAKNTGKIGILWLGDFSPGDPDPNYSDGVDDIGGPTTPQIVSTAKLIRWLDYTYGIDSVVPHSALDPGSCPGACAMGAVNQMMQYLLP
jgi:RHS repeat-associated protein